MELKEKNCRLLVGDSLKLIKKMPHESVNLIFTDPPYNIGIKYDSYDDNKSDREYISWCEKWLKECCRLLKQTGSIYVVIGDEYVAEINLILKKLGLYFRNWIIWHYGFGQNQRKKFSRAHAHILYYTKNKKNFTFNTDEIRIPSIRQKMNDKRANPKGKVPDDVWKISRVAGTFKERVKGFPCQMPLKVVERAIKASSNKGDLIFDPFMGSGTTGVAAKKLSRNFLGIDISKKYCKIATSRLKSIL